MINSALPLEKFLQRRRFIKVRPFLLGDILDFGGNKEELSSFVKDRYLAINYDHSAMDNAFLIRLFV